MHHTAFGQVGGVTAALRTVIGGRNDLPGPLCQVYIDRAGQVHMIAAGRANHAGPGYRPTRDAAQSGTAVTYWQAPGADTRGEDGNRWWLGIEVENDGVGEPYTPAVIEAMVTVCAAWVDAFGWHQTAVVHHRQHTRRKVDMRLDIDMPFWVGVKIYAHYMDLPPGPQPVPNTPPSTWELFDVNIRQHTVAIPLDGQGNGYGDALCSISNVLGHPRFNGTNQIYNVPTLRWETYGADGITRIEVQGGVPGSVYTFVVSEAYS